MAGLRGPTGTNPAEGKALIIAIGISIALLIFSLLAHFLPLGSAPIGGSVFNQLTVAQFVGGVGGGIGAVIVGATLWLQHRALEDLRKISETSHQFEAYAIWRALDESINVRTTLAVANVLSAFLATIRDEVLAENADTPATKPTDIEVWHNFGVVDVTVTAEYKVDNQNPVKVEMITLRKEFDYVTIAVLLSNLGFSEASNISSSGKLLSGEKLADDDVRLTKHLTTRFIMYLEEAEKFKCVAQCVGLISDLVVRQYLDLLVRIRSVGDARSKFEHFLRRNENGQIDNILIGSTIWDADDVRAWQRQASETAGK